MDLSIVIPCYNEVDNVEKLQTEFIPVAISLAAGLSVEVIFVDDGSSDGTLAGLKQAFENNLSVAPLQMRFEQHIVNRGLGAAIRTGMAASSGEVVVTTDSDGTYKFSEIPPLLSFLVEGVDMVTASPYHPQGGVLDVPRYRLVLSQGSSFIYRILVDWRIHTYTALFRAYRRRVVESVPFESNGFLAGTEILVNGILMGFKVAEYPAVLHSRVAGASKAKIMRTIRAHLGYQWHIFLCRLSLAPRPKFKNAVVDSR